MREDIFEVACTISSAYGKPNYSRIARQYNCDPRTVKRYFESKNNIPTVRKPRIIPTKTDGFEDIIKDQYLNHSATAVNIFNLIKNNYGYTGSYSTVKRFIHNLKKESVKTPSSRTLQ